jgi:putative endonuclease
LKKHPERSEGALLQPPKVEFYVYILSSLSGTLYVGLTDDLVKRVHQHKDGPYDRFTKKYEVNRLMYYEAFSESTSARLREIQIKKFRREKKIALFEKSNPNWEDLSRDFWGIKKASASR